MIDLLADKRALVTGGSRGIGAATARAARRVRARTSCIGYRSRAERCRRAWCARIADAGCATRRARGRHRDARTARESLVGAAVASSAASTCSSATPASGRRTTSPLGEMDDERWRRTMRENLDSVFYTTRAVARVMRATAGASCSSRAPPASAARRFTPTTPRRKGAMISFDEVARDRARAARHHGELRRAGLGGHGDGACEPLQRRGSRRASRRRSRSGRIATRGGHRRRRSCSSARTQARHITGEILNVNGGSVLCG